MLSLNRILSFLLTIAISLGLLSCGDRMIKSQSTNALQKDLSAENLVEVAPPATIQQLDRYLEKYQPQITILSPQTDEVFQDTKVNLQLKVKNLPIFKNSELELGPHLNVVLDNEPHLSVYDLDQPIVFENLSPGTHIIRVFASSPWNESFKNPESYAQTTFNVVTKTENQVANLSLPLLTYSEPQGTYGAEPILLDFYLTNASLRQVGTENPEVQIRATVNGKSFILDTWQPIYLKGFQPGQNWVQLELIDSQGNKIDNAFNDTVRLFNYEPNAQDSLSKIIRDEISLEVAQSIVDPNYKPALIPTEPEKTVEPIITPEVKIEDEVESTTETKPSLFKEAKQSEKLESPELEDVVDILSSPEESKPGSTVTQSEETK